MANDCRYGLGASVYTKSLETAMRAMENIKAGTFWINDPLTDNDAGPFGGMRWSGMGRELGEEGLDAFREPKHVHLDYVMERKPYSSPTARPPPRGGSGTDRLMFTGDYAPQCFWTANTPLPDSTANPCRRPSTSSSSAAATRV